MNQPTITSIGQIAIAVSDIKQSLHFYREQLGLTFLFEAGPNLAFLQCGDTRLMLTTLQGDQADHHTSVIYYRVTDLGDAVVKIEACGIEFIQKPQLVAKMSDHELWQGFIRDPDDNLTGIMAELPLAKS